MALLPPTKDYTDQDFASLLVRVRKSIRSVFPEWDDADVADLGNILVEAFCHVGDVVLKVTSNNTREAFWEWVTQRRNILALCKMIGFTPRGNTASQVDLSFFLATPAVADIIIPAGTRVRTESIVEPVVFETTEEVVIEAGSTGPVTVTAENSEAKTEFLTATGLMNFRARLTYTPFLDGSLVVTSTAGPWSLVENFLESTGTSQHFTVVVDQEDRATVQFGNGINGAIPNGPLTLKYKVGGGAKGRVEANKLRKLEALFQDTEGNVVALLVNNVEPSTQAQNRMSVEQIRYIAPLSLRTQERSVTNEDFEIHALQVPGVARALFLTAAQDPAVDENEGILFLVPEGGGTPTQDMLDAALEKVTVEKPKMTTFRVRAQSAVYLAVNVQAIVYFSADGEGKAVARARIQRRLESNFLISLADGTPNPTIDFGYKLLGEDEEAPSLAWSDVLNIIRDTTGVRKVGAGAEGLLLNGERSDLAIRMHDFPVLGTVTIIDGSTMTELPLDATVYKNTKE